MIDFGEAIRRESERFREVMGMVKPEARVPSCPGWTASDLLWHLTEVQMFWGLIVEHRLMDPSAAEAMKATRPGTYPNLLDMFDAQSSRLVGALTEADPADACWSWDPAGGTVAWVQRRQAHEVLIHRLDAELAARSVTELEPELATDGIDELLRGFMAGVPEWGRFDPDGVTAVIESTDTGRVWPIAFGRFTGTSPNTGTTFDLDALDVLEEAPSEPACRITGKAGPIDAWLWGRGDLAPLAVDGDPSIPARIRAQAVDSTQ